MNQCVNQLNVLRMVRANSIVAAHYLAAEERHRRSLAEAAQARLLREGGPDRSGFPIGVETVRRAVGTALVWTGRRVQGGGRPETVVGTADATA